MREGHPYAAVVLGDTYLYGGPTMFPYATVYVNIYRNFAKAVEVYQEGVDRTGHAALHTRLGLMYARGYGVRKSAADRYRNFWIVLRK